MCANYSEKELSDVYDWAVSVSRALAHSNTKWTPEEKAQLQGERAGYLFRYNELLGYRAER